MLCRVGMRMAKILITGYIKAPKDHIAFHTFSYIFSLFYLAWKTSFSLKISNITKYFSFLVLEIITKEYTFSVKCSWLSGDKIKAPHFLVSTAIIFVSEFIQPMSLELYFTGDSFLHKIHRSGSYLKATTLRLGFDLLLINHASEQRSVFRSLFSSACRQWRGDMTLHQPPALTHNCCTNAPQPSA